MKIKKTYLFLFLIPLLAFSAHKYYLSLTQIEFKPKEKTVQIIMNVFMDDIEAAINKTYSVDLQLTTKKEVENNDIYFKKYIKTNFAIKINNKETSIEYLGKEYEDDLIFFYLEISNIEEVYQIEIVSKMLTKHFPKQQNLIKVNVNGKHKSELLTAKNDKCLLKF